MESGSLFLLDSPSSLTRGIALQNRDGHDQAKC
jgi:hypothetical protein